MDNMLTEEEKELRVGSFRNRKHVHSVQDFPHGDHLAIIEFGTITIPGDERSRQHPGHGYPEHSEPAMTYIYYTMEDRKYWEYDISQRERDQYKRKCYIALDCGKRVTVTPIYSIKAEVARNRIKVVD